VAAPEHDTPLRDLFIDRPAFDAWAATYRARLRQEDRSMPSGKRP
jgi:uncharacterized protein YdiU (UPF0061 family)